MSSLQAISSRSRKPVVPIRVMLCDDSAVMRSLLGRILASDLSIEIVVHAANGLEAINIVREKSRTIDVIVLDIEMPEMDGLTALPLLLKVAPNIKVVVASSLTTREAQKAFLASGLGAIDFVAKPNFGSPGEKECFKHTLLQKVRYLGASFQSDINKGHRVLPCLPKIFGRFELLAIGSSTGGPQALALLLQTLVVRLGSGGLSIPIVLTQHMPPKFTKLLAEQLTRLSGVSCVEAVDGTLFEPGNLYIAPGDRHLLVTRTGSRLSARLDKGPHENFCRPSVDPMLRSAIEACDGKVLLLILTGMGRDGLAGARELVERGGTVFCQDEASSVVWGMPGAVVSAGLCHAVLPVDAIAERVAQLLRRTP